MKLVYVKVFMDNLVVPLISEDDEIKPGDYVIVETKYGKDMGMVISEKADSKADVTKKILSKATESDIEKFRKNRERDLREFGKIKNVLKKHHPNIHFVSCYFTDSKVIINFSSENRIDFRETVKVLARMYKTRIEMRQISPREAFKIRGWIGICGMECCCYRFNHLKQHVSASLVREQGLSEINAKIIGPCGKLLCCLVYESYYYKSKKSEICKVEESKETYE